MDSPRWPHRVDLAPEPAFHANLSGVPAGALDVASTPALDVPAANAVAPVAAVQAVPPVRWRALLYIGIALSFVLTLGLSAYFMHVQHVIADDLADNATPSLEKLGTARAGVFRLALLVHQYVEDGAAVVARPGVTSAQQLESVRQQIGQDLAAYFLQPTFPGEQDLWRTLHQDLWQLDHALGLVQARMLANDVQEARRLARADFAQSAERTTVVLLRLADINSSFAHDRAKRADEIRFASQMSMAGLLGSGLALLSLGGVLLRRRDLARS